MNRLELDYFLKTIVLFGAFFAATLAAAQVFSGIKGVGSRFLIWIYGSITVTQLSNANVDSKFSYTYPMLTMYDIPVILAIGPLLLFLISSLHTHVRLSRTDIVHFLPSVASIFILFDYFVAEPASKANRLAGPFLNGEFTKEMFLYGLSLTSVVAYICFALISSRSWFKLREVDYRRRQPGELRTKVILLLVCSAVTLTILGGIFSNYLLVRLGGVVVTLYLLLIFILGHRFPALLQEFTVPMDFVKYERKRLRGSDSQRIAGLLANAMSVKQVYLESNITLNSLAKSLGLRVHHLSQYINETEGMNFNQYINCHRIERAKQKLLEPDCPIYAIAFQVGFNSVSAFGRAFKEGTGMVPSAYRRQAGSELA